MLFARVSRRSLLMMAVVLLALTPHASAAIAFHTSSNGQNGGGSNSLAINKPTGVVAGDFLLAQITIEKGSDASITAPSGWALVRRTDRGTDIGQAIYRKVAGASEPTSYTWTFTNAPKAAGGISRYSGVDTANPIIESSGGSGDSNTLTAPGVNALSNSMLVAYFGFKKKGTTLSVPSGMTGRYNFENSNDVTIRAADEIRASGGATGDRTSTPSPSNSDKWVGQLVTLRSGAAPNQPPTCAGNAGPFQVNIGSAFSTTITGSDPDGGTLTAQITGKPAWLSHSSLSGPAPLSITFSGTPSSGDVGPALVNVTFTDAADASVSCAFTVEFVNRAPTCSGGSTEPYTLNVGQPFNTAIIGSDPDGEALTASMSGLPSGATASPLAGASPLGVNINWTPAINQVGSHNVQVTFADPHLETCSCSFSVIVTNLPPVGGETTLVKVNIGDPVSHLFSADDADPGDVLSITHSSLPAGAALLGSGSSVDGMSGAAPMGAAFNWIPAVNQVGQHTIIVRFTDLQGEFTESSLIVCVHNRAPMCLIDAPDGSSLNIGEAFSFSVDASDLDPGDTLTLHSASLPAGAMASVSVGHAHAAPLSIDVDWTPTIHDVGGPHTFEFTFRDFNGAEHVCSVSRSVVNRDPVCIITAPAPADLHIGEPFAFQVVVSDLDPGDQLSVLTEWLPAGAVAAPAGVGTAYMTVDVVWTPTINDVGPHVFAYEFIDFNGGAHECSIVRSVVNRGPQCSREVDEYLSPYNESLDAYVITAGKPFEATFSASDLDAGDSLRLAAADVPAGATLSHPVGSVVGSPLDVVVTWTPTNDDAGAHEIALHFEDSLGEATSCSAQLWVNRPPVASCGGDMTLNITSGASAVVTLSGTGSDPEGNALHLAWHAPGIVFDDPQSDAPTASFPLGTTMATLTVTDSLGGVGTCDMFVTVQISQPVQVFVTTNVATLWPPNHKMVSVQIVVTTSTDCLGPLCALPLIVQATSSEPDDAPGGGDGNTTGDVDGANGYNAPVNITNRFTYSPAHNGWVATIQLRAERDGARNGRCYGIEVLALDNTPNITLASCCVVVPKSQGN